jgi:hypothetical protein
VSSVARHDPVDPRVQQGEHRIRDVTGIVPVVTQCPEIDAQFQALAELAQWGSARPRP